MVVGWAIDSRQTGPSGHQRPRDGPEPESTTRGRNHSFRPGRAVCILGLQPEGHRSRPRTVCRCRRRAVRQCDGLGVLGACRSSYSTANDGRRGSSSPALSTTTLRIWHNTKRRHSALSMLTRPNTRANTNNDRSRLIQTVGSTQPESDHAVRQTVSTPIPPNAHYCEHQLNPPAASAGCGHPNASRSARLGYAQPEHLREERHA